MSNLDSVVDEGGVVSVTTERKPFPLTPSGLHRAVCVKAVVQEQTSEMYGDSMQLKLHWKLDTRYKDEDSGDDKNYMVFSSFGLAYGPKARLYKACMQLTGKPPVFKSRMEKRGGKNWETRDFVYKQFENMVCQVMVEHTPSKDGQKTWANIATYLTTDEEKKYNCQFLPDSPGGEVTPPPVDTGAVRAKMTEAPPPSAVDGVKAAEEVFAPTKVMTAEEATIQKMNAMTSKAELEQFWQIFSDPNTPPVLQKAYADKMATLA